ncbi:MAG: dihydroorotase [Clostridia bacterium]|nr:dihydroorotase [Clostridia bacterium]
MKCFGKVKFMGPVDPSLIDGGVAVSDFSDKDNIAVFPGFCDVHVHFREPGFSYKETVKSGSLAAAHGGYTTVCTMPNLNPVPDSVENLALQLDIIKRDASVEVIPYGAITVGEKGEELADLAGMAPDVVAFSDDGRGVQSNAMMEDAMRTAKSLGKLIVAHCEVNSLLRGGYIHDGEYARAHGHRGICSESEYAQIARDLELVAKTGCAYHVCHISAKESVELLRQAKKSGLDVSGETGPHYLIMDDSDLREEGRFKMNPPLRAASDREALLEGILDGTLEMIATDHAPHSAEEKSRGLEGSPFGIVGLDFAFPWMYTKLVKTGIIPLEKLIDCLSTNPRKRFGLPLGKSFSIWDLDAEITVDEDFIQSQGKATPILGEKLIGKNLLTVCGGRVVWESAECRVQS